METTRLRWERFESKSHKPNPTHRQTTHTNINLDHRSTCHPNSNSNPNPNLLPPHERLLVDAAAVVSILFFSFLTLILVAFSLVYLFLSFFHFFLFPHVHLTPVGLSFSSLHSISD